MAICERCGVWFDDGGEDWKTLCLTCWKRKKRAESGSTDAVDYWRGRCLRAENRVFELEIKTHTPTLPAELRDYLKDIIVLCHPDKHGGADRATRCTQYLLSLRELLT